MVGNACAISMPYIDRNGQIVMRGDINGSDYQKVLFVATEMTADEIQTLILAYVSGVNEKTILLGNYTPDEFDRVKQALDIIDKYGQNFIIECIPDPSIAMIKARLTKYIVQDEVEYIFYDYIFTSPSLITEFASADVKEYVALMMLSNTLKEVAMNYKVFIQSATQLNDGWSKKEIGLRDQNCLRGSKAIADKIDIGLIGVRLNEEERKQIDAIWTELKRQNPGKYRNEPNIVIDIYKNRRGELNCVKIFRYFDYGTCHCEDLFVTDPSYQAVNEIGDLKFEKHAYDFLDLKTRGIV
jgi:replicative DNA helicase